MPWHQSSKDFQAHILQFTVEQAGSHTNWRGSYIRFLKVFSSTLCAHTLESIHQAFIEYRKVLLFIFTLY